MRPQRRSALLDHLVADRAGSSQQAVLGELRRAILDGGVPPGTPIPLAEVAEVFGVSQIPVREALKTLVAANDVLEQAVRDGDGVAYHRGSRAFHAALTRPSRMHRLLHMLEAAWNVTEPVQSMVHVGREDRAQLHADHGAMLAAFLAGDAGRLLATSEEHAARLNAVIATLPTDTGLLA